MAKSKKQIEKDAATLAVADFEVLSPLKHDGDSYVIGEPVELTEQQAEPLLAQGIVKRLPVKAAASTNTDANANKAPASTNGDTDANKVPASTNGDTDANKVPASTSGDNKTPTA